MDALPLSALRSFEAVARRGSMSGGAADLNVTHGAVSRQIAALELRLGIALFERGARGVRLTPAGTRLYADVAAGFGKLREALSGITAHAEIRLTALPSFATRWLLPRLVGFNAVHPDIQVRVHSSLDLVDLLAGGFDLAIRYGRGHWPGVVSEPLLCGDAFPVCAPSLLDRLPSLRVPTDLLRAPLVHNSATERWSDWFEAQGVSAAKLPAGPVVDDYALALEYAVSGHAVALGREPLVRDDLASGRLVVPVPGTLPPRLGYYLVRPRAAPSSATVERFALWLREAAT